ncbi:MAG: single-stranded DNA-binding protein [Actinomycetota bacterium]
MADNSITLVGNLTRDPELRFTTGGKGVASFSIAVGRRYQVNGEWQEQTSYFNIVSWGQMGENAAATLTKGMRVIVSGRLEQREYQNREGEKRTAIEINADEIGPSLRWATASVERTPRAMRVAATVVEHLAVVTLAAATLAATSFQTTKNPSKAFFLSPVTLP